MQEIKISIIIKWRKKQMLNKEDFREYLLNACNFKSLNDYDINGNEFFEFEGLKFSIKIK